MLTLPKTQVCMKAKFNINVSLLCNLFPQEGPLKQSPTIAERPKRVVPSAITTVDQSSDLDLHTQPNPPKEVALTGQELISVLSEKAMGTINVTINNNSHSQTVKGNLVYGDVDRNQNRDDGSQTRVLNELKDEVVELRKEVGQNTVSIGHQTLSIQEMSNVK